MQNLVNKSIMFVGDFNIDILDEVNASEFSNIMYSHHFFPLINIQNRVTENAASCLDHIWYNSFNSLISGSFILDVSDHYPSFTPLNIALNNDPVKHVFRDHSIKNINKLIDNMPNFQRNFNLLFNYDVNKKQNGLLKNCGNYTIVAALKKTKIVSYKTYIKPWITDDIKSLINQKHVHFKNYKRGIIPYETYNQFKNNVTKLVKKAKTNFYFLNLIHLIIV